MTRIEWTRRDGDDVEAVVAMFVNRERPNSTRITPSRGDGGVDILDRAAGSDGRDEVHQVKRYADPLTSKQRTEVEKSLDHLMKDPRWKDLDVGTWYLVTPWDPTPEADAWLQGIGAQHNLTAVWRGLTYVEQLAARYPDVVDYYLNGDASRIEDTYKIVLSLLGLENVDATANVPSVTARIEDAIGVLDHDPHYRYELRFGQGELPPQQGRPGLVMTTVSAAADGGKWTAVDVIARCAASVEVRPITVVGNVVAETGSEFERELRDFLSYGTPFESPYGAYTGEIDAPGGLGGRLENAKIATLSVDDNDGGSENRRLRADILDPDGTVLGSVEIDRVTRSKGADGLRVVLQEVHGIFTIDDRYNITGGAGGRVLKFGEITGKAVSDVHSVLGFILHCHAPNVGWISQSGTPPELGVPDPNWTFPLDDESTHSLKLSASAVAVLARIQRFTRTQIRVPDFAKISRANVESWRSIASVLEGEAVTATYPEGNALIVELESEFTFPDEEFGVDVPLEAEVGDQRIPLGQVRAWIKDATLLKREARDGHVFHFLTTPDRTFVYRRME